MSERIRGFTLPNGGEFFLFDYDEVFRITLGDLPSVEILDDNTYDFSSKHPDFLGVSERIPLLQVGDFKLSYAFDPSAPSQEVTLDSSNKRETISFRTFSGDWFVASLSPSGEYLLLAEPYLIEVYSLKLPSA